MPPSYKLDTFICASDTRSRGRRVSISTHSNVPVEWSNDRQSHWTLCALSQNARGNQQENLKALSSWLRRIPIAEWEKPSVGWLRTALSNKFEREREREREFPDSSHSERVPRLQCRRALLQHESELNCSTMFTCVGEGERGKRSQRAHGERWRFHLPLEYLIECMRTGVMVNASAAAEEMSPSFARSSPSSPAHKCHAKITVSLCTCVRRAAGYHVANWSSKCTREAMTSETVAVVPVSQSIDFSVPLFSLSLSSCDGIFSFSIS